MSASSLTTIDFHGSSIHAIAGDTPATTLVAMRPLVEGMGMAWSGQFERIERDPHLASCVRVTRIQLPNDTQARDHIFLPLNRINGWLMGVKSNRVAKSVRPRLLEYQAECFEVLFDHFFGKATATPPASAQDMIIAGLLARVAALESARTVERVAAPAPPPDKTEFVTMREALASSYMPFQLWRNAAQHCSIKCATYLRRDGKLDRMTEAHEPQTRRSFQREAVTLWLKVGGGGEYIVSQHAKAVKAAAIKSQGVLPFIKPPTKFHR